MTVRFHKRQKKLKTTTRPVLQENENVISIQSGINALTDNYLEQSFRLYNIYLYHAGMQGLYIIFLVCLKQNICKFGTCADVCLDSEAVIFVHHLGSISEILKFIHLRMWALTY